MTYSIYRYQTSGRSFGRSLKERLIVKSFKCSNDMYDFLNKPSDTGRLKWRVRDENSNVPEKSGTYAFVEGSFHNVKDLDSSLLAHC